MRVFLTLMRREWMSFFLSPVAYVIFVLFLVLMGLSFSMLISLLAEGSQSGSVMRQLLGESLFFWLAMLMAIPTITMRQFAEEKHNGTIESLMTAPLTDLQVVLAKFCGGLGFFAVLWLPTMAYAILLAQVSPAGAPLDYTSMISSYIGILLIGAFYLSVGLLASSLTRNQAVAAVITFVVLCSLFFWGFVPYYARGASWQEIGRYTSSVVHMMEFSRGVLDTRPVVFYISGTAWFLFITTKVLESRKWRA